jgi:hypothetical protein
MTNLLCRRFRCRCSEIERSASDFQFRVLIVHRGLYVAVPIVLITAARFPVRIKTRVP